MASQSKKEKAQEAAHNESKLHHTRMMEEINKIVRRRQTTEAFFFIHVNTMCQTFDGREIPCELTVAEFSLCGGFRRFMHTFIKPRNVPLGYKATIMDTANNSHHVDLDVPPMRTKASSAHYWMVRQILDMVIVFEANDRIYRPLYTMDVAKTQKVLAELFTWGGFKNHSRIPVYHVQELFFGLANEYLTRVRVEIDLKN